MDKSLPKDDYDGPILAGQRWRSRGTGGHNYALYAVLRYNGRSVVVAPEGNVGRQVRKGRKNTIPEAMFRANYVLVAQAPGVTLTAIDIEVPRAVIDAMDATAAAAAHREFAADTPLARATSTKIKDLYQRGQTMTNPVADENVEELVGVIRQNREERAAMNSTPHAARHEPVANPVLPPEVAEQLFPPPAPPEVPEVEPVVVDGETVDYTAPVVAPAPPEGEEIAPASDDPLDAFLTTGQTLVDRLSGEIGALEAERDRLLALAEAADAGAATKRQQHDRIAGALRAALAALEDAPPPREALPPRLPLKPQPIERRGGVGPQPGQNTQRAWVLNLLQPGRTLLMADIVPPFAAHFGLDAETSRKNIASILGEQMRNPVAPWPTPVRVERGVYATRPDAG